LMGDDWNRKGPEELAGRVLQETDADDFAEALKTWAIRGVRIGPNGDGGDAKDGAEVYGIGQLMEGIVAFLLPRHGDDDVGCKEALIGVEELNAGLGHLTVTAGIEVN